MSSRILSFGSAAGLSALLVLTVLAPAMGHAQRRGRKYKAPPPTSHITVDVLRNDNGKPIGNAAVVFHSTRDGHDEGNLEVKTNEDGVATIDVIPTGSQVEVQVIADGFATFANEYYVPESTRDIQVKMLDPRAQVSAYEDNSGKASQRSPGVQEPAYLIRQQAGPTQTKNAPQSRTPANTPADQPGLPK